MKTIIGILLIGFLGCLGCSDNDTTATVDQAVPVAPFGITDTTTPTFEWTPVPGATRYQLLVEENDVPIIDEWYTAEEAECASEDGLCSVTPDVSVFAGGFTWTVMSCAGEECGLWSDELQFSYVVQGPTPQRFTDNGDGTVTDTQGSQCTWTKNIRPWEARIYDHSVGGCKVLDLGGSRDWRIPTVTELMSVLDRSQPQPFPHPPIGPPFDVPTVNYPKLGVIPQFGVYWTSTSDTNTNEPGKYVVVHISEVAVRVEAQYPGGELSHMNSIALTWPVRKDK